MPRRPVAVVLVLFVACVDANTTSTTETEPTPSTVATMTGAPTTAFDEAGGPRPDVHPSILVVPLGQMAELGDYDVTLLEVMANATAAVLSANQAVDPPPEGEQFVLLTLKIVYRGEASGTPDVDLLLIGRLPGDELMECSAELDSLRDVPELLPDEEAELAFCVSVPSNRINGLLLEVNPIRMPHFRPQFERRQFFETWISTK